MERSRDERDVLTLNKVDPTVSKALFPGGGIAGPRIVMARRTLVPEAEIADRLKEIPQWSREGNAIARTWKFKDFPAALRFINKVGELAESVDHHPDIHNSWATVRLVLTTHDKGGLTNLDFELAKKIDA